MNIGVCKRYRIQQYRIPVSKHYLKWKHAYIIPEVEHSITRSSLDMTTVKHADSAWFPDVYWWVDLIFLSD